MAGKAKFDQEAAFRSIIGETAGGTEKTEQKPQEKPQAAGKGRPKAQEGVQRQGGGQDVISQCFHRGTIRAHRALLILCGK